MVWAQCSDKRNSSLTPWPMNQDPTSCKNPIQTKALALFNSMKIEKGEEDVEKADRFESIRDWFMWFKERSCLHNIKVKSEALHADVEDASSYSEDVLKIINEGSYTK